MVDLALLFSLYDNLLLYVLESLLEFSTGTLAIDMHIGEISLDDLV